MNNLMSFHTLFCILLFSLLPGCTGRDASTAGGKNVSRPVITTAVTWENEQTRVEAVGTSRALRSVTLFPEVAGEVVAVHFSAGQKVKAGQTLLELDSRDEKLAVDMARVELADAQRLYDRYRRTEGSGAVTVSTLDDAKSAVDRARLALARAEVALNYCSIKAPFAGYVGLTTLDPGARIDPNTAITTIDDRSILLVTFELPEILLGKLKVGDEIALGTWADSSRNTPGKVVEIDSRVDPQTRTFTVRAHVDNADDGLRPGMSFRIVMTLAGRRYPFVPEAALQWGGEGAYVWAVRGGKATRVSATVVQRREGRILLDAALPEGTPVVVEGVQRMREGQAVHNVAESETPARTGEPAA
jgi:RND family efflux transporter MFP subunit